MESEPTGRRILVTGARGNVGREVVRECLAAGLLVRAGDRSAGAAAGQPASPNLQSVKLDFLDRATWAPALADCGLLFLLRPPPIGDMTQTLIPFVDAAYAAGVQHIVFLSVAGADRMKWVPHRKVELHLISTGTRWTLLRPGFFAQNFEDAYRRDIVEDQRLFVPAGEGRVAFIDVRDVGAVAARVFANTVAHEGQALTLTGPTALTFFEAAAVLSSTLGRPIRYEPASIAGYAWHLRRRRAMPWMQIVIQTVLHVGLRRGDAEKAEPTVEALLGRPARSLADYARDSARAWS